MQATRKKQQGRALLLVDGQCQLCSKISQFVIARDQAACFRFATLQSPAGQYVLEQHLLSTSDSDTFVMIEDGCCYTKSEAALRVLRQLKGLWPLLYGLMIVPALLRNVVYDWIAAKRYGWFGQVEHCLLPNADQQILLIEEREEAAPYVK
ncbi:Predicted thiol-disulfide oxidoreductase YuxK, DCC family [Paenibacillus algorifonticola]|uniref:Predicted thiol-disulfide oxidoreductase YuxK, DCC family n=1 Tax=Paenibacillus algorifonticola TaxID=684063 RepID=A0A1I1Z3M5_9BACL|nr:DCC1-like thiol-disulfide oxidoreductase family protein [Paenibacillus algorifonticola]SFE26351.1 Predicted thiol-disulfide oxidoreductase YuxK, DCC family [Paenibacillus algorifonticola]